MKLYEYWLGLYPLDWEFCIMSVQRYKDFITEQYQKNPIFYNMSANSIEQILAYIDDLLSAAMEEWNQTTNHAALRCPPKIFPLPKGQESNAAEFAIILKMDNDGDTVVYSPIPLPHLESREKREVIEYCKYIVQCLVNEDYADLEKKGILARVSQEDIKRVLLEYDGQNHISMPTNQYFNELDVNEYNDKSGYWIDINMFYNDQMSDLTLQLDFRKNGLVLIDDLHVL